MNHSMNTSMKTFESSPQRAAKAKIHLNFQGYWRAQHQDAMPNTPGVYCVYRCTYDAQTGTVRPIELLDIGEALAVRDRVLRHTQRLKWRAALLPGEELCFTFAPIIIDRKRAASALSAAHRPRLGAHSRVGPRPSFDFEDTEVILSGRMALLQVSFSASRTRFSNVVRLLGQPAHQKPLQNTSSLTRAPSAVPATA